MNCFENWNITFVNLLDMNLNNIRDILRNAEEFSNWRQFCNTLPPCMKFDEIALNSSEKSREFEMLRSWSCGSRKRLRNEYSYAKIGTDTAKHRLPKGFKKLCSPKCPDGVWPQSFPRFYPCKVAMETVFDLIHLAIRVGQVRTRSEACDVNGR